MRTLLSFLISIICLGIQPSLAARVGGESRVEVLQEQYPASAVGLLESKYIEKKFNGECTATLIGPSLVITAAHCVYTKGQGGWADIVEFAPDAHRNRQTEQDIFRIDKIFYLPKYIDSSGVDGVPYDLVVLHLESKSDRQAAGEKYGWLQVDVGVSAGRMTMISYPGNKPESSKWIEKDCALYSFTENVYSIECDTYQGSSGSAILVHKGKDYFINGVFTSDNMELQMNFAGRFEPAVYEALLAIQKGEPQALFLEHLINKIQ